MGKVMREMVSMKSGLTLAIKTVPRVEVIEYENDYYKFILGLSL